MKTWIVYKHTSMRSGKSYIGITSKTWKVRWQHHCCLADKGSSFHFHRAIRLYGKENWTHSILANSIDTLEEAQVLEKYFIKEYDTFENGYNMTFGGECVSRVGPIKRTEQYDWVHEEHGRRYCTIWELLQEFPNLVHSALSHVVNPHRTEKVFKGWQLYKEGSELIQMYKEVAKEVVHLDGRIDNVTPTTMCEKYNLPKAQVLKLFRGYSKTCHGWKIMNNDVIKTEGEYNDSNTTSTSN